MEDEKRNLGPITADHHLPQFSSEYLPINAGGMTTEMKEGSKIRAEKSLNRQPKFHLRKLSYDITAEQGQRESSD